MKKQNIFIAGAAALLCLQAQAQVLLTEDFESYTAGNDLTNASSNWQTVSGIAPVIRDESTSTAFGATNQYGEFNDTNTTNGIDVRSEAFTEASAAVTTFQFDFYESATAIKDPFVFGYAPAAKQLNGSENRARGFLTEGTISNLDTVGTNSYSLDTVNTLYMIFNDSGVGVANNGRTTAATSADIWIQQTGGSAYYVGSVNADNTLAANYYVGFRTFNSQQHDMDIDNVILTTGALTVVPESSTALLIGLVGLALLCRRRA